MSPQLVCTSCHRPLEATEQSALSCGICGGSYPKTAGYWNFTDGGAGTDPRETPQGQRITLDGDLPSGRRFVQRYLLSKLQRLGLGKAKILSAGCGLGEDVAELRRQGYEAYGIEMWGLRASKWADLDRSPEWYYLADARKLPFGDRAFDIVLCVGLIEHIGAVGDSSQLYPDWREQRTGFLREVLRVSKHGVFVTTPNRTFPADLNHIATDNKLLLWIGRRTGIWFHPPLQRFYLSYHDIERHIRDLPAEMVPWDIADYFGFSIRTSRPWLRAIIPFLDLYFRVLDRSPQAMRKSFINPWVSVFLKSGS